jgi:Phosphodiester glycosidase
MKRAIVSLSAVVALSMSCRQSASAEQASTTAGAGSGLTSNPPGRASGPVDLTPLVLSDVEAAGLRVQSGTLGAAESLDHLLPPGGLAVVNGGYFEADFRPSTWLVADGKELSPKADTSKGGVLALGPGGLYVGPVPGLAFPPLLAVQSFPLIVEAEGKPGIRRDDGRRAARTIACLVGDTLHFIVIAAARGDGPTLFEAAALLSAPSPTGFGCRRALNLDGGPSSGVWFGPEVRAKPRPPFAKVGYAIAILPR